MRKQIISPEYIVNILHVVREILFYFTTIIIFCLFYISLLQHIQHSSPANVRKKYKLKNSELENTQCISLNRVCSVQLIYNELGYSCVKVMEVAHRTDIKFHLTYSAVMKY